MISPARLMIAAAVAALLAAGGFWLSGDGRPSAIPVTPGSRQMSAPREAAFSTMDPVWREAPAVAESPAPKAPDPNAELRRRMEEACARLPDIAAQREASRTALRWLKLDRAATLAWLEQPHGANLDPILTSVSQALAGDGECTQAQLLAEFITDPAIYEWAHQNALAHAYERKLITTEQLRSSGLSPAAVENILGGSFRD
jgi:hypothetical protein